MRRLGPHARPFTLELTPLAPPSVQLVPAKQYSGAPIGTSYDVRAYVAERPDEKLHRRSTVRMGIRVIQRSMALTVSPEASPTRAPGEQAPRGDLEAPSPPPPPPPPPHASAAKPFLLSDGKVELEASLDRAGYCHGDTVSVHVAVANNSNKTVRRIKDAGDCVCQVFVVQHVDVCMFSNGKFKNVVATGRAAPSARWGRFLPRPPYELAQPWRRGATKMDRAPRIVQTARRALCAAPLLGPAGLPRRAQRLRHLRRLYVKVKLLVGAMGGELSLKLPFTLVHAPQREKEQLTAPLQELVALVPPSMCSAPAADQGAGASRPPPPPLLPRH
ncbi:Phosrestin-2 [Gryllus bimaculatus]|nr:Phosrestin-2 [Gryllus bimaculatus]